MLVVGYGGVSVLSVDVDGLLSPVPRMDGKVEDSIDDCKVVVVMVT